MSLIERAVRKIWVFLIEGRGIRGTWKKIWNGFWKEIDRILGVFAREVMKLRTPIVKNKIFFHTQENRYTCNPKYICEELLRQGVDVDIVWRVSAKSRGGVPQTVRAVKAGSFGFYKEIFSSKIIILNGVLFKDQVIYLKKKQTLIETWHGSLGIKRFGRKEYKSSLRWVRGAIVTGRRSNYCISNGTFVTKSLRDAYWPRTPMLEYGHPRNDLFFDTNKEKRESLREILCEKWGVDPDSKFIMYGPTFRDAQNFDCYNVDFDRLVTALKERFGGSWCVLLRYHPTLAKVYKSRGLKSKQVLSSSEADDGKEPEELYRIINVTGYIDMQELIAITDVAITDYSSWIYDFMLLRRPGFIFATDIDLYNTERGFYYPLEETPFPIATDNDVLTDNILHFDNEKYLRDVETFLEAKGCIEDGHASERVVELIKQIIAK